MILIFYIRKIGGDVSVRSLMENKNHQPYSYWDYERKELNNLRKRSIITLIITVIMILSIPLQAGAAGISYLPDVTSAMSSPSYWTKDDKVLMTWEEIETLNAMNIAEKNTNMNNLLSQPETVNGITLNENLKKSSQADAEYYLKWTYLGEDTLATQEDFDPMIANTQNPNASASQAVRYGVAVHRTELRAFPSEVQIWDDPKDPDFNYQFLVSVRVNEPLVITSVSKDGKYYLAKSVCCSGWVPAEDVAVCRDREEWLSAWDLKPENVLVVYGDKVYTQKSNYSPETSSLLLTMGTVLEIAPVSDPNELIDNRAAYQNYAVWMPIRKEDGSYAKKRTLISEHAAVSEGYLPMTEKNIAMIAFEALGNNYGWGGSLLSEDCSAYIRNIYKCFGLELARNTTWQQAMPVAKVNMTDMCREERLKVMDSLPLGSILYFSGHEMMYLGSENGKYYVVSAISSIRIPGHTGTQRIRSIVINTLDIQRASGATWLDCLTTANVPYWGMFEGSSYNLPGAAWYHEGVAYCTKKKIMKPYDDGFFYPEGKVTRAQTAQILWNLEKNPKASAPASFDDVAENAWYAEAVAWATENGLMTGHSKTVFSPDASVTREQMAAVLYRYAQYKKYDVSAGENTNILSFSDAEKISEYAVSALQWAAGEGLINGIDGKIVPQGSTTRAQEAVILMRFCENAAK